MEHRYIINMKQLLLIFGLLCSLSCFAQDDFDFEQPYQLGYGLLYSLGTVQGDTIAPSGWHVPTKIEMDTLINRCGGTSVASNKLREIGLSHWNAPNTGATNESGFNARGSGLIFNGGSYGVRDSAFYWSASITFDWSFTMVINNDVAYTVEKNAAQRGGSLRFVKDDSTDPGTLTDYDGNVYPTVKIGTQVWTAANWNCTHFRLGGVIKYSFGWGAFISNATWGYYRDLPIYK